MVFKCSYVNGVLSARLEKKLCLGLFLTLSVSCLLMCLSSAFFTKCFMWYMIVDGSVYGVFQVILVVIKGSGVRVRR